jgi:hypothetical protein
MTAPANDTALLLPIRFLALVRLKILELKDLQEITRVRMSCHFSPSVSAG